jgi:predicted NUDIX family NTP pyrophosphohydrolase
VARRCSAGRPRRTSIFRPSKPGHFETEWPPRSGKRASFPEIDRLSYFDDAEALRRVLPSQAPLIAQVLAILRAAA